MRVKPRKKRRSYTADQHSTRNRRQRQQDQKIVVKVAITEQPSQLETFWQKIITFLKRIFKK